MNGEKQNGEKPQQTDDIWAAVTVSAEPAGHQDQAADYERTLEVAGYGDTQRQHYVKGAGEDAECASETDVDL